MKEGRYRIAAFYRFGALSGLPEVRQRLLASMKRLGIFGTVIIAEEGFNATISGAERGVGVFLAEAEQILGHGFEVKDSFHAEVPFRRRKVKIKSEIVTLRKPVNFSLGSGTHVGSKEWNVLISDPATLVLDTRNGYEVEVGRFRNAVDPGTESFGELPDFVEENLDPEVHKRVAMYCTGGIRCEKFAPYMKSLGFEEVYQLRGGILKYLEEMPVEESLWEGECFVFDDRISVGDDLSKGSSEDPSFYKNRKIVPGGGE